MQRLSVQAEGVIAAPDYREGFLKDTGTQTQTGEDQFKGLRDL